MNILINLIAFTLPGFLLPLIFEMVEIKFRRDGIDLKSAAVSVDGVLSIVLLVFFITWLAADLYRVSGLITTQTSLVIPLLTAGVYLLIIKSKLDKILAEKIMRFVYERKTP